MVLSKLKNELQFFSHHPARNRSLERNIDLDRPTNRCYQDAQSCQGPHLQVHAERTEHENHQTAFNKEVVEEINIEEIEDLEKEQDERPEVHVEDELTSSTLQDLLDFKHIGRSGMSFLPHNPVVVLQPKDGNCLFHGLAYLLSKAGRAITGTQLRF